MSENKKISQLPVAGSVNPTDYTVLVDGNTSQNKRATLAQILASGTIGGTVTSVAVSGSNGVSVSGSPVTTSGTIALGLGNITPTSVAASGAVTGSNLSGTNTGDQTIQLVGDVEASPSTGTLTTSIAAGTVTNAKLANMTGPSFKGRVTGGAGAPSDLSPAQVAAALPAVVGDSGSGGTQGLVPAPGAGDAAAKKFLRADGTWQAPAINDLLPTQSGQSGKVLKSDGTNVSWQADSGGSGTVTSVGIAGGTDLTVSGSPVTGAGSITLALSTTGAVAGSYGSASSVPAITVDAKGRIGAVTNTPIAIAAGAVSGLAAVATSGAYSSLSGTPSLGTISSQNSTAVNITGGTITGITDLAVADGGTGASNAADARTNLGLGTISTQAANNVAITGGTMANVQVTGLPTPTGSDWAATKAYVDSVAIGVTNVKSPVRVATTANITLSGAQTIDGISVIAGNRVLVKDQSAPAENGIYVCAAGAWSRSTDADTAAELQAGVYVAILEGTANGGDGYILTTAPTILGTDPVAFTLFMNNVAGVSSITGTAGQITASSATGAVTLSLPTALTGITSVTAPASTALALNAGTGNSNITLTPSGTGRVDVPSNNFQVGSSGVGVGITPNTIDRYAGVVVSNVNDFPAFSLFVSDGTKNVRGSMFLDASTTQERWAWDMGFSSASNLSYEWRRLGVNLMTLRDTRLEVLPSTASTSTTTGCATFAGGIGVAGDVYAPRYYTSANTNSGIALANRSTGGALTLYADGTTSRWYWNGADRFTVDTSGAVTFSGGSITGGASGLTLNAGGTNQNITLTPSGTGVITSSSASAQLQLIRNSGTDSPRLVLSDGTTSSLIGQVGSAGALTLSSVVGDLVARVPSTKAIRFTVDGGTTTALTIAQTTGNLLVGTTTDDGATRLQVVGNVGATGPFFTVNNTTAAGIRGLRVQTSASDRWIIGGNGTAESGSNAGTNFQISAYNDAGAFLGTWLTVARATGVVNIASTVASSSTSTGALTVAGGVGVAGQINATSINIPSPGALTTNVINFGQNSPGANQLTFRDETATLRWAQYLVGSELQFYSYGGAATVFSASNAQLRVNATTASTTSSTGALRVDGGAGIVGNLNVGGTFNASPSADGNTHSLRGGTGGAGTTIVNFLGPAGAVQASIRGDGQFVAANSGNGLTVGGGGTVAGASGGISLTAVGTAQNISLAPSTTGAVTITAQEGASRGLVIGGASPSAGFPLRIRLDRAGATILDLANTDAGNSSSAGLNIQAEGGTLTLFSHSAAHSVWPDTGVLFASSSLSGGIALGTGTTAPIVCYTNNSERVRISDTGLRVGTGGTHTDLIASATATLDFGSISAASSADLTITVTGASTGDSVHLGLPSAPTAGIIFQAFVSASNTVTVRATNITGSPVDPASATYRVTVMSF